MSCLLPLPPPVRAEAPADPGLARLLDLIRDHAGAAPVVLVVRLEPPRGSAVGPPPLPAGLPDALPDSLRDVLEVLAFRRLKLPELTRASGWGARQLWRDGLAELRRRGVVRRCPAGWWRPDAPPPDRTPAA